jgi:putative ABC transport system permease protein
MGLRMFKLNNVVYKKILYIEQLEIPKNKVTSIVGESGSGKSTLLRLLNKLISCDKGEIYYNNLLIDNIDSVELRRKVVMLPQQPVVFPGNIKENLLIGLKFSGKPEVGDDKLTQVLEMVSLKKKLGDDTEKLSGGEKQRVALGRIILMKPEVYLLDEPSSALDDKTEEVVIEKIVKYIKSENKTLVMVTHSKKIALDYSDNIVEIDRGGSKIMDDMIKLQLWQVAAAYAFVILLLIIVRLKGISREKEILISSVRMTLQLIFIGYLLIYIFEHPSPVYSIIILAVMEIFSIYTILKRTKISFMSKLGRIIAFSMSFGSVICLFYFLFIVINISPWYEPRYFIPIGGMLIGNSMTGITLGVNRLVGEMSTQKHLVEGALMLGATPKMAAKHIVDDAFDSAILPTINSMLGMGIVFLPGMMTGQILSGASPVDAISYQIAIMLGILGSVSLTVILFVQLGCKTFFNEQKQLYN